MSTQRPTSIPKHTTKEHDMTDPRTDTEREADEQAAAARADLIEWLSSSTTTTVRRTKNQTEPEVHVEHVANFGIERGTVEELTGQYSVQPFLAEFMVATWTNGKLNRVALSGKRVLKGGRRGQETRDLDFGRWSSDPLDRDRLPEVVQKRLADYERDVAVLTGGRR